MCSYSAIFRTKKEGNCTNIPDSTLSHKTVSLRVSRRAVGLSRLGARGELFLLLKAGAEILAGNLKRKEAAENNHDYQSQSTQIITKDIPHLLTTHRATLNRALPHTSLPYLSPSSMVPPLL